MSRNWHVCGVVEAEPAAVFAALAAGSPYSSAAGAAATPDVTVEVDPARRMVAVEGRWWYRGETSVREHPRGSLVEYRVRNVARRGRWVVPLMQYRLPRDMRRSLDAGLRDLGRRLDCAAYLT